MKPVIINDGETLQVDLVPENEHDKAVLAMFVEGQTFQAGKAKGYALCRGGYLRPFEDQQLRSFVYLTNAKQPEQ